jgi:hypothetical protein
MSGLSPTMRACLETIEAVPGQPAKTLPGGLGTVWALMRRGLVEVSRGDPWLVFVPAHQHEFKAVMHLDGCHFYRTNATCDCGVIYGHRGERSLKHDPYSAVWMEPTSDVPCERCTELMNGARPVHETVIQRTPAYSPPLESVT